MAVLRVFAEPKTLYDCLVHLARLQYGLCCCTFWRTRPSDSAAKSHGPPNAGRFEITLRSHLYPFAGCALLPLGLAWYMRTVAADPVKRATLMGADKLLLSIAAFELCLATAAFIVTSVSMQCHSAALVRLYDELQRWDVCVHEVFGAEMHYRKLMRKLILTMPATIGVYGLTIINATLLLTPPYRSIIGVVAFVYLLMTTAQHTNCFVHMNSADLLRLRFRLLQKILRQRHLSEHKLAKAVKMVRELHDLVPRINSVFKMSLIVAMGHDFTVVTSGFYMIFAHAMPGQRNYTLSMCIGSMLLMPFYKIIIAPIYCDLALAEGNKCIHLIENLDNHCGRMKQLAVRNLIKDTLYWRLENKVSFMTGTGIFYNRGIIAGIISGIVSYMFILMQFQFTKEIGEQIDLQKNVLQDWIGEETPREMGINFN